MHSNSGIINVCRGRQLTVIYFVIHGRPSP